ncbi:MAG TPA: LysM domain-containing protein [Patescibacteria group bacterium]|nr:LysM domain-containing protein [Patescibacteria group bacterium]
METGESKSENSGNIFAVLWVVSVVIAAVVGYFIGHAGSNPPTTQNSNAQAVTQASNDITPTETVVAPTTSVDMDGICSKSGPSQQKDYLVPYILQAGDSFQSIAEKELGDGTRVSELTALNDGAKDLTVGSTIYLPPKNIKSSSGHIVEVSGKVVKKDNSAWQLSYGGGEKGMGVVIPAYYLKDVTNSDTIQLGDCVTVLMDNGVKAYSVTKNP